MARAVTAELCYEVSNFKSVQKQMSYFVTLCCLQHESSSFLRMSGIFFENAELE